MAELKPHCPKCNSQEVEQLGTHGRYSKDANGNDAFLEATCCAYKCRCGMPFSVEIQHWHKPILTIPRQASRPKWQTPAAITLMFFGAAWGLLFLNLIFQAGTGGDSFYLTPEPHIFESFEMCGFYGAQFLCICAVILYVWPLNRTG
jgi:hypothetical protein